MNRSIEAIPTWSLCYIINGDASGLTDEEIRMVGGRSHAQEQY